MRIFYKKDGKSFVREMTPEEISSIKQISKPSVYMFPTERTLHLRQPFRKRRTDIWCLWEIC